MREIKFRAWDTKEQKWEYDLFMDFDGHLCDCVQYHGTEGVEQGRYILVQYTGLKDENGVEIYEGDIVKSTVETVVIEWKGEMWTEEGFITGFSELFEGANCYEVIGNIHENPELNKKYHRLKVD